MNTPEALANQMMENVLARYDYGGERNQVITSALVWWAIEVVLPRSGGIKHDLNQQQRNNFHSLYREWGQQMAAYFGKARGQKDNRFLFPVSDELYYNDQFVFRAILSQVRTLAIDQALAFFAVLAVDWARRRSKTENYPPKDIIESQESDLSFDEYLTNYALLDYLRFFQLPEDIFGSLITYHKNSKQGAVGHHKFLEQLSLDELKRLAGEQKCYDCKSSFQGDEAYYLYFRCPNCGSSIVYPTHQEAVQHYWQAVERSEGNAND